MAAQQPQTITFKPEDIYLFRLRKISENVSTRVIHVVFLEGISGKPESMSLFDYYDSKGVPVKKFKKTLDKKQIETIENDPKGKMFDVTLLYKCIQWGSDKVAPMHDDQWKEGNGSLESVLTAVKNLRNDLFHGEPSFSKQQFLDKTIELRIFLTETLWLAKTRFGIPKATTDQIVNEMSNNINLYRDKPLVPLDFDDYKKQIFFPEQGNFVRLEGKKFLCQLYEGWVFITPVSLMVKLDFKVNMIYTEMVLIDESTQERKMKQKYEDLLESINCDITDPVILVEGIAGVGKTTLTKKILNDWASGQTTMSNLTRYDLLLYAECRNSSIKSFKELIISLMPEIAKCFQEQNFSYAILDQKIILIIDGLDELNKSSTSLFTEVLELKKTHGLSIIATTRPEYVMSYYHLVDSLQIRTKHIKLIGIAQKKRKEFVTKYHDEMKKKNLSTQNIGRLLEYLKETELRLSDLWMLPYNLTLLVILWVDDPLAVYGITTAPELYWKIHQMILRKLIGRLSLNEFTKHIPKSLLKKKIEDFVSSLCREALLGLKNNEINLPEEAHQRLEDSCVQEGIPSEEMTGAFLKMVVMRTSLGIDTKYSFPHKGLQEFFGALKFFKEILKRIQRCNADNDEQNLKEFVRSHNLSSDLEQVYLRQVKDSPNKDYHNMSGSTATELPSQKTNMIREILEDLHGTSTFNIEKYQNLFITLIGMFFLESNNIGNYIKLEALELLKETGVEKSQWIRILNSVKCNSFVASFINKQPGVLVGSIYVNDASLFSYISLLKTLEEPLKDNELSVNIAFKEDTELLEELMAVIRKYQMKVVSVTITGKNFSRYTSVLKYLLPLEIDIDIEEKVPDITELMNQINQNKLEVVDIILLHEFMHKTTNLPWEDAFNQVFQRCNVVGYTGPVTPGMVLQKTTGLDVNVASAHCYGPLRSPDLKRTLSRLEVSVANAKCYAALDRFFQSKPQLHFLDVCLSLDIDPSILNPLPTVMMKLNLYLPDISTVEDISNATQIVKRLQPIDGEDKSFHHVDFPRLSLSGDGIKSLIRGLNGVEVKISLTFPFASKPSSREEEQQIQDLAKSELKWTSPQFGLGVQWGEHSDRSIDDW